MEVSLLECMNGAPLVSQVIRALDELGFVPYDFFGFNYRPIDQALAQVDIVFLPKSSQLLANTWYAREDQRAQMNQACRERLKKYGVSLHYSDHIMKQDFRRRWDGWATPSWREEKSSM